VRVRGARFALPPGYHVEGSRGCIRAWNRRAHPDRALLIQIDPSSSTLRREGARVIAAAEANGDRVIADSYELLDVAPATRVVFRRHDGGTSVSYVSVHLALAWDLRMIVAVNGSDDAVMEFERIVATFRFDRRPAIPTAEGLASGA
jgi:hypothetical protein